MIHSCVLLGFSTSAINFCATRLELFVVKYYWMFSIAIVDMAKQHCTSPSIVVKTSSKLEKKPVGRSIGRTAGVAGLCPLCDDEVTKGASK